MYIRSRNTKACVLVHERRRYPAPLPHLDFSLPGRYSSGLVLAMLLRFLLRVLIFWHPYTLCRMLFWPESHDFQLLSEILLMCFFLHFCYCGLHDR